MAAITVCSAQKANYNQPCIQRLCIKGPPTTKRPVFKVLISCSYKRLSHGRGHPLAAICLYVLYVCTLEQKLSRMPLSAVFYCVQNAIHHHYKEIACAKPLSADNQPMIIVNAFQMPAM